MIEKIINTVVCLFFFSLFVLAIGSMIEKEQEFARKCEALGMIVVEGFRTKPYCAKGVRP